MKNRWITKIINLAAGQVYQHECFQTCNTFLIRNTGNGFIYADLVSSFTAANADVVVPGNAWGTLVNPNNFKTVYLMASVDTQVKVVEAFTENPAILVGSMVDMAGAVNVAVSSTVGLMPDNLDLSPAGVLGVDVKNTSGLEAGDLSIDGVTKNLGVDVKNTVGLRAVDLALSAGVLTVDTRPAESIQILTVNLDTANSEFYLIFPERTNEFIVKVLGGAASDDLRIAFEAGKVASSISPYFQIRADEIFQLNNLNLSGGKRIYFASPTAYITVQVVVKY